MASLATFAAPQPTAVKGLAGSSLAGTKLHVRPSRVSFKPTNYRSLIATWFHFLTHWYVCVCVILMFELGPELGI